METIGEIIEGCKKRDIHAQKKLYVQFFPVVKNTMRSYIKDSDQINDLVQECFLKIFDKITGFSGEGSFEGWIKRLASNMAIDYYRKNNKLDDRTDIDLLSDSYYEKEEEDNIVGQLSDVTDLKFIRGAIDQLPFQLRIVFVLFVMEQKSHDTIAKELMISIPNSRKRLQTARTWLKQYLMDYYKETVTSSIWK